MNFTSIRRSFATTLLFSIITSTGSASAYRPIQDWYPNPPKFPEPLKCSCNGKPVPPRLCPVIRCIDEFKSSSLHTILQVGGVSRTDAAKTNDLIAGRYQTRGPGAGIGRGISANNADVTTLVAEKYPTSCTGLIL
ncbi:hypothetical protein [Pseudanabaena sp. ABRG5-3]|uniref:hypothetical protein n=1 Tax=Pseudanabaena sp. ABRG5-3 TaxID=685565 RepID=UPI000F822ADA|nr:hypothetical protein [Pseudanabaena sp. ABRG5-3]